MACKPSDQSVPRGRVYASYVSRCGNERVTVLNPASFGKLVRVIFPDIKTRRLGVRGESKYHYCNLTLIEDQPELPMNSNKRPINAVEDVDGNDRNLR
jgi:regulatory factor X